MDAEEGQADESGHRVAGDARGQRADQSLRGFGPGGALPANPPAVHPLSAPRSVRGLEREGGHHSRKFLRKSHFCFPLSYFLPLSV